MAGGTIKSAAVFLFTFLFRLCGGVLVEIMPYCEPSNCDSNEYFDAQSLRCIQCNAGKYLQPSIDKLSCECNSRSRIVKMIGRFPECEKCPENKVPTSDKLDCISCKMYDLKNNETVCASCEFNKAQVAVERYFNGSLADVRRCYSCISGTSPSENGNYCLPCLASNVSGTFQNCTCPQATHELINGFCISLATLSGWADDRTSYVIQYDSGIKIDSYFLRKHLRSAIYLCKMKNQTACQMVANMCTLVMFQDDYIGSPCKLFQDSKHIPTSDNFALPWLYYGEGDAQTVLSRKKIPTKFNMDAKSPLSRLNLTVIRYTADGRFIGLSAATGSFLQLCPADWTSLDSGLRFGIQYQRSCRIPALQLLHMRETEFLDLYLQYWEEEKPYLYAVPVLCLNMDIGGKQANRGADKLQWQFTRRFFQVDKISGIKSSANKDEEEKINKGVPSVIRYLKSCKLKIKVQGPEEEGRICPPLLVVEYADITMEEVENQAEVTLSFSVEYDMENSMFHVIEVSLGILSALAIIWSGIETWSCSRRSGRIGIDFITFIQLTIFACGNLANVFFLVMACISLHTFTFYKGQSVTQVLLPSKSQEDVIKNYIVAAFLLKVVEIVCLIWKQISVDIFFIDWERPRARSSVAYPSTQLSASALENSEQPVSIWRTYFIANEWNEIQTKRRISLVAQLTFTVFILKVWGVENWATPDPELHRFLPAYMAETSHNFVCRFAVGIAVYLLVYFGQLIFMVMIYERYIKNGIQEFVDICSMANISVFILAYENYGYYIHGRSAHGFADTDMQTILSQLHREEEDLCGHRGLLPGSDQQTFQMAIPHQLRAYYRKVMAPINTIMLSSKRLSVVGAGGLRSKVLTGNMDRSIQAYHSMNKFLAAFLEHALKDLDYDVREKQFAESLLDIEFTDVFDKGIFYVDNGHSFDRVLFYGNEFTLTSFDIMIFLFVEALSQDFLMAAILTAFVAQVLIVVRQVGGRRNLAKKTLIDERFLI